MRGGVAQTQAERGVKGGEGGEREERERERERERDGKKIVLRVKFWNMLVCLPKNFCLRCVVRLNELSWLSFLALVPRKLH